MTHFNSEIFIRTLKEILKSRSDLNIDDILKVFKIIGGNSNLPNQLKDLISKVIEEIG